MREVLLDLDCSELLSPSGSTGAGGTAGNKPELAELDRGDFKDNEATSFAGPDL